MPTRLTKHRLNDFIAKLEELGGSCGNGRLRRELDWEEDFYWRAQGQLVEEGLIVPGRGQGGTVRLTRAETGADIIVPVASEETSLVQEDAAQEVATLTRQRERDLYVPLKESIETKWVHRFGFDEVKVEETHSRGSRDTGGTFTRPDITTAGIRRYVYLPKRLEIISFEVKPADGIGVMAVLEAIAHREAAHRSYVMYACSRSAFDGAPESERILELAQKYAIGVVLVDDPQRVEKWEILLDAIRHEPDPARLDRFLSDLPSDTMRNQLSKWKE